MPNTPEAIISFYAINKIGAVASMIHPLSAENEIKYYIDLSKSKTVIAIDIAWSKLEKVLPKTKVKNTIIVSVKDSMPALLGLGYYVTQGKNVKRPVEKDGVIYWKNFIKKAKEYTKETNAKTKGKDESSNRFISWLLPYDGKFADESELISIIDKINQQVNRQSNRTTNMPPITLFSKEKEYLKPLPNKLLLESYIEGVLTQTVPSTLLVSYKGSGYSVPPKFINKRVKLIPIDNKLYIYYNELLVTVHPLSSNIFNYKNEHYKDALKIRISSKDDDSIEEMASNNLKMFDYMKK